MSEMAGRRSEPLMRITHLSKRFPGCVALDELDLEIRSSEVLALVGQNGCGKSTFIKILSGFHQPDHGYTATFDGEVMHLGDPDAPHQHGIHFVHQDLGLLGDLSATENLAVGPGFITNGLHLIRWRAQRRRARQALAALGYDFDVTQPVSELSPSQRVGVAIARAMIKSGEDRLRLLVLDEPTASLPQAEVDTLFAAVRRLRDAGTAVVFVSHRLDEVFAVADRVIVMRDGRVVDERPVASFDEASLIEQILGRIPDLDHRGDATTVDESKQPLLQVRGLSGKRLDGLDFDARPGEIIGVTGLTGSGREELAPLLFGAQGATAGTVAVRGTVVRHLSPFTARALGMALVPASRRQSAILPDATVRENISVADLASLRKGFLVRRWRERLDAMSWMEKLGVKPLKLEESILNLSGGNQQKVILARWLRRLPYVLILDEPTQGVDVGTKPEIYALLREVAEQGSTVIVCSTDSEEIVEVSSRAIVLSNGRVNAELSGSSLTIDRLNQEIVAA
jgi:ribose transport system ATP-binding protein